jgi:hypothetical protein
MALGMLLLQEWLASTPKHVMLYNQFGSLFAHLPLLPNLDKSKMPRRQGDVSVDHYIVHPSPSRRARPRGSAPEDTQEIFSLGQLIEKVRSMGCLLHRVLELLFLSLCGSRGETLRALQFAGARAQGLGDRQHQQARLVQRSTPACQVHRLTPTCTFSSFFLSALHLRGSPSHAGH